MAVAGMQRGMRLVIRSTTDGWGGTSMVRDISAFRSLTTLAPAASAAWRALAGAAALLVQLGAQPALAADPPAASAQVGTETSANASESSGVLESITVTAQKRSENIQ